MIGWETIGTELTVREILHPWFLLDYGLGRLAPVHLQPAGVAAAGAAAVIIAWGLVPALAGARRTVTEDA